jgi:hypothetical protein
MNLVARGLGLKNTTRAQIDCHDVYSTCHIENLEKCRVVSKNQLSKGHLGMLMGKRGIGRPLHDMQG